MFKELERIFSEYRFFCFPLPPHKKNSKILKTKQMEKYFVSRIESNPNVERSFDMVYRDISPTRELYCIKYNIKGEEQPVQITGWNAETNSPFSAYACKVEESGEGLPYLFLGGREVSV
ncbi:MAG: hypothetical protein Ct9H300mP23_04290 [Nitrospinota bacterium]|nr:MAG: hypothetical protein Ct9H300mP23_04290 [Nitrospinota bacterium]